MPKGGRKQHAEALDVVGLIPAGGTGSRIAPLPLSKELFPIGFQTIKGEKYPRSKVVSHYLIDKFSRAGIRKIFFIIRQGKWDIPAYYGDGTPVNMHVGYLIMREPFGPPFTLDQAYPFVQNQRVAFGFPDILFGPEDVFQQLLDRQQSASSDVVLALYKAHNTQVMDMVDVQKDGKISGIYLQPSNTKLKLAWVCAVWSPIFTDFMHTFLQRYKKQRKLKMDRMQKRRTTQKDVTVGAVLQEAIHKGLSVHGVTFPHEPYLDIGTPKDLLKSVQMAGLQSSSRSTR